ncbi:nucleotidyltransferase domain-containing protein [Algoriphagus antarcticus]|uniref:Nucleotidyltransferase-like protein n=1 Tax=Algoriphagus antarcticus TaxID=238540 RepID=A0A3E0DL97_9BACT|nr:nucleotidyltransferase domain-containing protein [Algoriphagus antarcticus]REG83599.1 nucleotidyltransferase-like protein [Algoriphagus antarcticus]
MSDKDKIVKGIVDLATAKYPDSELYLFGSQTDGSAKSLSDWDILLLFDSDIVPLEKELEIMDDFYELELRTGAVISPIIYSKSVWDKTRSFTPLFKRIAKGAIRIK